ncbi:MAG: hypothetical protein ACHQ49_14675 [Elusimicrobiota bacterium]
MKTLALLILLAAPSSAAPDPHPPAASTATAAYTKILLDAQELDDALKTAEAAVAAAGGAEAYAARADAKFALGRPIDEVIADYAEAAKRDARFMVKYKGLIAQRDSEKNRRSQLQTGGRTVGAGANGLAMLLALSAIGCLLFVIFLVMVNSRESPAATPEGEKPKKELPHEDV